MNVLPETLTEDSAVISKLLFDNAFEEEKLTQERKIILNELAEAADDPTEKVEELLLKNLFKNHPIRRPVGGFPKTIKRLTVDQLKNAHETNYVPQNMILILTGNFSEKSCEKVLEDFGSKPCGKGFTERKLHALNQLSLNHLSFRKRLG